ncbi:RHS repeat-associated core domain-containing protein [Pseudomonas sp. NFX98]|uniref:RHS repeat-associated core domain-containing protein n=1 Tax=Pseudomonas sp. NFX98 TaxID=3399122 RepID=UPI0039FD181F
MPSSSRETVLCRYHYDPLDRQNGCTVPQQPPIQQFHNKDRLTTEIHGASRWSFFQHDEQLLAQRMHQDANATTVLLATDQQRSVLNVLDTTQPNPLAYTPYGHRPAENGLLSLLGFNGERPDPLTGHYHLGNGYRQFNPVLMRFNSPDSWSPFGEGGVNAYAYCEGNSITRTDQSGHAWYSSIFRASRIFRIFRIFRKAPKTKKTQQNLFKKTATAASTQTPKTGSPKMSRTRILENIENPDRPKWQKRGFNSEDAFENSRKLNSKKNISTINPQKTSAPPLKLN